MKLFLMHRKLLVAILLGTSCFAHSADAPTASPVRVVLHDSGGLSAASTPDHRLDLNLFKSHTHIHLLITNVSDQGLVLWKPYCPQGDDAIVVEFRDPLAPSKVFRARPGWAYTGGMGMPKVLTLAGHDSVIVNFDFVSDLDWVFPIKLPKDERMDLEVRVGYHSQNLSDEQVKMYGTYKIDKVWEGKVMGEWQKIIVRNASGKAIGPRR